MWGAATSSHQVEGDNENNDWWAWEQIAGRIEDGTRAGLAANWWRVAEDDLALAAKLGHNTHRLSLEWSRLEPIEGAWDEAACVRYREILTAMRRLGIRPMVTLHHFSLPLWLYEQGGWENSKAVACFARYAERVLDALGDTCTLWVTINEPMVHAVYGHVFGVWPPGYGGLRVARRVMIHQAEAHARAYEIIHRLAPDAQVGFSKHIHLFDPSDPRRLADRLAAGLLDRVFNTGPTEALCFAVAPFPLSRALARRDARPVADFIGLNYYSRSMVRLDLGCRDEMFLHRFPHPDSPYSMDGWGEIYAEGLYRALVRLHEYGLPIYVTEFGVPDSDDSLRPRFIVEHVEAMRRAANEGVPLRGAYFWSLVDNFEWAAGWSARFGLIGLDIETQRRIIHHSAQVYRRIAQTNGLPRDLVADVAPDRIAQWFGNA